MGILVLGISHHRAPIGLRERLAYEPAALPTALGLLRQYVREGVILSTCNRTEIYAVTGHHPTGRDRLLRFLADSTGVPSGEFAALAYDHWQEQAVRHLFRVAAGLDSMLVGEAQVLGQVRAAFGAAQRQHTTGPVLSRLFQQALEVGKAARTRTGIGRKAASVGFAAVERARAALGSLEGRVVLVVGAGETGELVARALLQFGARELLVTNRTRERAQAVAERCGGRAVDFARLGDACADADIVITCTAAPRPIVSRDLLATALAGRPQRPLFIVDVAIPRDVEPEAATLPGVHLFNLDDLQTQVEANLATRRGQVTAVEALIDAEVPRFTAWWEALDSTPTIRALVEHADAIRRVELARALARLGALSDRDRETIDAMSCAIVKKLLHEPIVRLKRRDGGSDGQHHARAVRELFGLDDAGACSAHPAFGEQRREERG